MALQFTDYKVYTGKDDEDYLAAQKKADEYVNNGVQMRDMTNNAFNTYMTHLNNGPQWSTDTQTAINNFNALGDYNDPNGYKKNMDTYAQAYSDWANKPFTYDLNADALYQQYRKQYMDAGRLAMQDTLGQATALTGGYGNSYATTAGNQAYQAYLGRLNEVIPELEQLAYSKYRDKGSNYANLQNMYGNLYAQDLNQYNTKWSQLYQLVQDGKNMDVNTFNNKLAALQSVYEQERGIDATEFQTAASYLIDQANNAYQRGHEATNEENQWKYTNFQLANPTVSGGGGGGGGGRLPGDSSQDTNPGAGTPYAGWKSGDWRAYFQAIYAKEGASNAKSEIDAMRSAGYISSNLAKVIKSEISSGNEGLTYASDGTIRKNKGADRL